MLLQPITGQIFLKASRLISEAQLAEEIEYDVDLINEAISYIEVNKEE